MELRSLHIFSNIRTCKTCLDYFGLAGAVRVGIVGGMGDIIEAMHKAQKVISL